MKQETMECLWHQLDHMQLICTMLQTDNRTSTLFNFFAGWMLFLMPSQQYQSTEGSNLVIKIKVLKPCDRIANRL